nr:MAG TPA: DNA-directed RNA polymerase I [Caudoviricetes sp.]
MDLKSLNINYKLALNRIKQTLNYLHCRYFVGVFNCKHLSVNCVPSPSGTTKMKRIV